MGNVLVNKDTLTAIADAIREKSGSDIRYKPARMPDAILAIETESGADLGKPVRFYGAYGELIYSYSWEEIEGMTELPSLPDAEGLVCQGWNWSLESIQEAAGEVEVGAIFITDDGSTRIYIELVEGALEPYLGFAQAEADSVQIDWGDGSELETSSVSGSGIPNHVQHRYAGPGEYVIRLIPLENAKIYFWGSANNTYLLHQTASSSRVNSAYKNCIRKIELGNCIAGIGTRAFNSESLEYIIIPEGITDIQTAFQACTGLRYMALPKSITKIVSYAFRQNSSLERICLSDYLTSLASYCFEGCCAMEGITFPESVNTISTYIMSGCTSMKKVRIPAAMKKVANYMFQECTALREVVLEEGITEIGGSSFAECSALESVILPDSVTKIGNYGFYGCILLRKIQLPSSLKQVEANAFANCYSLAELTLPETVTSIGNSAFDKCYCIENYYVMAAVPPTLGGSSVFNQMSDTCRIHVPKGCLEAYRTANYWSAWADHMVEMEE